mmetsp:Transcript_2038/g.3763  ORF Transcript_2038/g.3763 Transcript_2038/m.3763 type:complete len:248 (-) Transcript_2038:40-783(-)
MAHGFDDFVAFCETRSCHDDDYEEPTFRSVAIAPCAPEFGSNHALGLSIEDDDAMMGSVMCPTSTFSKSSGRCGSVAESLAPSRPQVPPGVLAKPLYDTLEDMNFMNSMYDMDDCDIMCEAADVGDAAKAKATLFQLGGVVTDDEFLSVPSPFGDNITIGISGSQLFLVAGDERDFFDTVARVRSEDPQEALYTPVPSAQAIQQVLGMLNSQVTHFRSQATQQLQRWNRMHPQVMAPFLPPELQNVH